ncbi:MAG: dodecin domain-containing protein [Deltaproteobacteria bacterium]|nr:dodecin domain-containing protein [Deltaproteobacteria bacterium]
MRIAKIRELEGASPVSYEDAAAQVIRRASKTVTGITGFQVLKKLAVVEKGKIVEYRVRMGLIFELAPNLESHW